MSDSSAETEGPKRRRGGRARGAVAITLAVLCCIGILASVVGVWARQTIFSTDHWVEQVGPLASNEEVLVALGDYLTYQIVAGADLENRLKEALPSNLDLIAAPVAASAKGYIHNLVDEVLHTEQFRTAWVELNRVAHEAVVRLIEGTGTVVQTDQPGTVTINLLPVINKVLQMVSERASGMLGRSITFPEVTSGELPAKTRERLSNLLGRELPADFGQIVVYESGRLGAAQEALLLFKKVVALLVIVTLLLGGGAVAMSRRRPLMLIGLALGAVFSLALGRAAVGAAQRQLLELIVKPQNRQAAAAVISQMISSLTDLTTWLIGIALVLLVVGVVVSDLGPARRARDKVRSGAAGTSPVDFVGHHRDLFAIGGIVAGVLAVLVASEPTWGTLILVIVVAGLFEAFVMWAATTVDEPVDADPDLDLQPTGAAS